MEYRPVTREKGGTFASLTPEIDRIQEHWENVLSIAHTQIQRCIDARWKVREAVEERRVIPVDFSPRPPAAKPPRRAA